MQIKRTSSVVDPNHKLEDINLSINSPQEGVQSENYMSIVRPKRTKVPLALQSVLRQKMSQRRSVAQPQNQQSTKQSKVATVIKSRIRRVKDKIKQVWYCQICECEIQKNKKKKDVHLTECDHKKFFCQSCLHHYAIYKINNFEEVLCPREGCNEKLDLDSPFFKSLPVDIQNKYKKINQFFMVSKDPNLRICPKQDCQGIARPSSDTTMTCQFCHNIYCNKCLLPVHDGECDNHEVQYFQSNLHYRQCQKCKFIVQRSSGCNHMTCRCGFNFCYVCGNKWSGIHYNAHDQNGVPILGQGAQDNIDDCDCDCLTEACGQTCASIIKFPLKLFLVLIYFPLMLLIWFSRDIFIIIAMFFVSILAGMFGFSFQLVSEAEGIMCVLSVLFFPITMIVGIGVGFKEIFCDVVPDVEREYCDMLCEGLQGICSI